MAEYPPFSGAPVGETTPVASADPLALPPGTELAEFRVIRVLGNGGFGIVYLAHDNLLHRDVAIKEYLPASLAGRTHAGRVVPRSTEAAAAFSLGLKSFVNEARLLARFDHASLVKVHCFWEDHGTAYMVMPYYVGATLRQVRKSLGEPPDEKWLKRLLDGLLGTIDALHRADIVHRDVAPDNILMLNGGAPLLLDFGAARHVLAEQPQMLTATLKPTYAPIEQYASSAGAGDLRQGPWTDLYATAATLHYCLTGEAPPAATARTLDDRYRPLHRRADLRQRDGLPYDGRWLAAIDWALEVLPSRRPQSVAQWRAALDGRRGVPWQKPRAAGAGQATERGSRNAREGRGKSPLGPFGGRLGALFGKGWTRGRREQLLAAGALGLVSIVGFAQFNVLPQFGRAAPAPMASGSPMSSTDSSIGSADPSGMAKQTALPPPHPVDGGVQGVAPLSQEGSQEIHETAAEQGRVITVPRRTFDAPLNGSDTGRVTRTAAEGSAVKPTQRRIKVARAPAIQTPREFCEADDRGWFSRIICMHRSCDLPKWREHAQCTHWRSPTTAQREGGSDAY